MNGDPLMLPVQSIAEHCNPLLNSPWDVCGIEEHKVLKAIDEGRLLNSCFSISKSDWTIHHHIERMILDIGLPWERYEWYTKTYLKERFRIANFT